MEDFGHEFPPGTLASDIDDGWASEEDERPAPFEDDQRETGEWHPPETADDA